MGNFLTKYNFDTNGKFVSGIAKSGTEGYSHIVGFYVSDFGQTSEYRYQARLVNSVLNTDVPNTDLNVFFPPGWFLSGVEHYQKKTEGSFVEEEQIHYIITDGYNKKVGHIQYKQHNLFVASSKTEENNNKFSCTSGEYVSTQNNDYDYIDSVLTMKHDYKCSAGGPRPIPASNVGATGPLGPRGWHGEPGGTGKQGIQGLKGEMGLVGETGGIGLTGSRGLTGDSGLTGPQGAQGIPGIRGLVGITGSRGPMGLPGSLGTRGLTGDIGISGIQGNTGPNGETGPQGIKGAAFESEYVKTQLNVTSILLFLIIVYVIVWVSSFSTVLGTSGTVVGDVVTDSGDMIGDMITDSGETASGVVSGAGNILGGMISGTGRMLGGAIGGTSNVIGGAIGGTTCMLGGAIGGTSTAIGGAMDVITGGSVWM
jgi:hypothetical protein